MLVMRVARLDLCTRQNTETKETGAGRKIVSESAGQQAKLMTKQIIWWVRLLGSTVGSALLLLRGSWVSCSICAHRKLNPATGP